MLHPAPLRDLLMHLALTDLFRSKWTEAIHEEWIRSVLKNRPDLDREQLERTRQLMNAHVRERPRASKRQRKYLRRIFSRGVEKQ